MMTGEQKIVATVARLVERNDADRAELIVRVERRRADGEDPSARQGGGLDWKAWAVDFAQQNPRLVMFAPLSLLCWFLLIYQSFTGG